MKKCYTPKRFNRQNKAIVNRANIILNEYSTQGFVLTLRQLYYQFVARGLMKNSQKNYKRLGAIIGDARLAGLVDWSMLEDRTRNLMDVQTYESPASAIASLVNTFRIDRWEGQDYRPEVWIEKDALVGVIEGVCADNGIPYFSCRGYTSLSEMHNASLRMKGHGLIGNGQIPFVIHLGDHDPSGMDMSRDIQNRLKQVFMASEVVFKRIALNMDQIEEFQPPPNPAKVTDSRYKAYTTAYGDESWELDALDPAYFRTLIQSMLNEVVNKKAYDAAVSLETEWKSELKGIANEYPEIPKRKGRIVKLEKDLKQALSKIERLQKERVAKPPNKKKGK